MISRISGRLEELTDGAALLDVGGGLWYEALIPACDMERLRRLVGREVVLYTIHYLEGDPSHGSAVPRLVGFLSEADREFFRMFTTVKGIGIRKALRALARPVAEIAAAIQAKDAKYLVALPEIGGRTAERIVAELHGKLDEFAAGPVPMPTAELTQPASEAIAVLVQLGERRADAAALVQRALEVAPNLQTPEAILQQAYRLKAGAK